MKTKKNYTAPTLSAVSLELSPLMEGTMGKYEEPDTGASDAMSRHKGGWSCGTGEENPWSED